MGSRTLRVPVIVLAAMGARAAHGEPERDPRVAASAFFGVEDFGTQIALGRAAAPEQRPQSAPLVGVRWTAILIRGGALELGVEPELVIVPAWTGYGFDGPRDSYFAPVFSYRASMMVRTRVPRAVRFHALAGVGGATVVSKSPYMSTDTDRVLYYGAGTTLALDGSWEMRIDVRQGFMPARAGGSTAIYEGMAGIELRFGASPPKLGAPPRIAAAPAPVLPPRVDDVPPPAPPPPDRDHDGLPDPLDKCPDQAEDRDGFQDDDGCPELDNDGDGIPDANDRCPDEPETRNAYQDDDGCPDRVPAALLAAFEAATAVRFEPGRARLREAAMKSLAGVVTQLHANPTIHVAVLGHPEVSGPTASALAQKRADAVKWYLVDQGVPIDQLETATGPLADHGRLIELRLGPAR